MDPKINEFLTVRGMDKKATKKPCYLLSRSSWGQDLQYFGRRVKSRFYNYNYYDLLTWAFQLSRVII